MCCQLRTPGHVLSVLADDVGMERDAGFPSMYHRKKDDSGASVYQDDIHAVSPLIPLTRLLKIVSEKIDMKWSKICSEGDRYDFFEMS